MDKVSCIVIAGGKSSRMGTDKKELSLMAKSFLEIALENAYKISNDVVVSLGDESQVQTQQDYNYVLDEQRGRGPLFGLVSALKKSKNPFVAVLPVDVPLIKIEIYFRMIELLIVSPVLNAVIPRGSDGIHPLQGVYRTKKFLDSCEKIISLGGERVIEAVKSLESVKYMETQEFLDVDPKLLSFYNVNTPSQYDKLKEILGDEKRSKK